MQASSVTSSSAAITSGSSLVDQVRRQAAILADDSGASSDQKLDAYIAISKAIAQSASSGSGWFQQSSQADRDAVNAIMDNSAVARQVRQAADDFNARGLRAARGGNVMADQISYLDGLSDQQQKLIFAGSASLEQTDTVDGWKGFLQQNADGRAAQLAAEQPAVKITLSDQAKAALAGAKTDSEDALATLTQDDPGDGVAGAALKMLQKAADQRAEAREQAQTQAKTHEPDKTAAGRKLDALI